MVARGQPLPSAPAALQRAGYDPAQPGGGTPKPYTHLSEVFLPRLRAAGVDEATIVQLTHDNPFEAFARPL